jgi:SAM-dependent methyltransferase
MAKDRAKECEVDNIVFTQVTKPDQEITTGYDLYYSFIVFQHNPPPIIARLIRQAVEGLAPGGVAVFQLPTFRWGYKFKLDDYMANPVEGIEMHALPQRVVFDIVEDCDCRMLDMFEVSSNLRDRLLSNFFTVQKRG